MIEIIDMLDQIYCEKHTKNKISIICVDEKC